MTDKALKKRREYYKKWRDTHKKQIRGYMAKYWEKQAQLEKQAPAEGGANG